MKIHLTTKLCSLKQLLLLEMLAVLSLLLVQCAIGSYGANSVVTELRASWPSTPLLLEARCVFFPFVCMLLLGLTRQRVHQLRAGVALLVLCR
jgi:hypothetical protein